jgi:hypothetical protein
MIAKCYAFILAICLIPVSGLSQVTVDATRPPKGKERVVDGGGSRGGVGLRAPFSLAIHPEGKQPDTSGQLRIVCVLTNTGTTTLVLPISTDPGDLEPNSLSPSYRCICLSLSMAEVAHVANVLSGATLCGDPAIPKSMALLSPGEELRVLTQFPLPSRAPEPKTVFCALAIPTNRTFHIVAGKTVLDVEESGYAPSPDFTWQSLLKQDE